MEEVVNDLAFWIDVIKGFFYVIGLLVSWNVFITFRLFELKQGLALNIQSDAEREKVLIELKSMLTEIQTEIHKLTSTVVKLETKMK